MKRMQSLCICFLLIFALSACGGAAETTGAAEESTSAPESKPQETAEAEAAEPSRPVEAEDAPTESPEQSSMLVLYFSRTGEQYSVGVIDEGNTAIVAKMVAETLGADLFEILPADDHYPTTYDELTDIAKQEQNENARPAYAADVPSWEDYDTVFFGMPVWWGDMPMVVYTFVEAQDWSGKTIVPFTTHEGSGLSGIPEKLAESTDATVMEGLAIRGADAQNNRDDTRSKVSDWLAGLGY